MNANKTVIRTAAGRHFHLFGDCRALAQGRRNSDKFGRELHTEWDAPMSECLDDAMFGCRECFKRAGETIPLEADLRLIRSERAAARAKAREAKAEAVAAKAAAAQPVSPKAAETLTGEVSESASKVAVVFSNTDVDRKTQTAVRAAVTAALAPLFQAPLSVTFTAAA